MEPEATINTYTFYEKYIVCLCRKLFSIIKKKLCVIKVCESETFILLSVYPFISKKNHLKFTKQCRQNLLDSR